MSISNELVLSLTSSAKLYSCSSFLTPWMPSLNVSYCSNSLEAVFWRWLCYSLSASRLGQTSWSVALPFRRSSFALIWTRLIFWKYLARFL